MTPAGDERRAAILRYLLSRRGWAVSHRDIAEAVGLASTSTVAYYLRQLADAIPPLVAWEPRCARTLRLTLDGVEAAKALQDKGIRQ